MPVCVAKRGSKWRIVDCESRHIERNEEGTPVDGGGHNSEAEAKRQAKAINANLSEGGKI